MATMDISKDQTDSLFLFLFLRSILGSAVRLGIVGPLEAQRILTRIRIETPIADAIPVQTAPVLDLLQATQDRLYSRLFQS
jgi:urease accessory protein